MTAALIGAVVIIAAQIFSDFAALLIDIATVFDILYFKKVQEPYIIINAAII